MSALNPNPRTWRHGATTIVDLERVAAILTTTDGVLEIYLVGAGEFQQAGAVSRSGPIRLKDVPDPTIKELVDAFEIYRTER